MGQTKDDSMPTRAMVLFSGGQDSTTCLYWSKQEFDDVEAVAFDYGQRHRVELDQARLIARMANVPLTTLSLVGLLGDSALTDPARCVNDHHPRDVDLPATFVPARNLLFLTVAAGLAYSKGIMDLVAGMSQTDYSGYPDCRREFVDSAETTLALAMAPYRVKIHTPLMHLDKADTFKLAADLGILEIILEHTHTDYNGDRTHRHPWGYGQLDNPASRLRAQGWDEYLRRYPKDARGGE